MIVSFSVTSGLLVVFWPPIFFWLTSGLLMDYCWITGGLLVENSRVTPG